MDGNRVAILKTIAYYDVFDYPLALDEILRFIAIGGPATLIEAQSFLDTLIKENIIGYRDGFYYLAKREHLVPLRLRRFEFSARSWRRAYRTARFLRHLPFLRSIYVSGSLALNNSNELSDIDILVIVRPGFIWLARFLILATLSILGVRRNYRHARAPRAFCANHWLTTESMTINFQSEYTARGYGALVPLIAEPADVKLFQDSNNWVLNYLRAWPLAAVAFTRRSILARFSEWLFINLSAGHVLDIWLGHWQQKMMVRHQQAGAPADNIVVSDSQLAFHPQSAEPKVLAEYAKRCESLGVA